MLSAYISILIIAIYGVAFSRRKLDFAFSSTSLLLVCLLTISYKISNKFTGSGITLSTLVHIQYGLNNGELGVLRFPRLVAETLLWLSAYLTWACLSWKRSKESRPPSISPLTRYTLLLTGMLLGVALHPATQDIKILVQHISPRETPLDSELSWDAFADEGADKLSLVYIYLESYERTFLEQELFPNLSPNLRKLESEALSIRGIYNSSFMNWTVAGMTASQCGMPIAPTPRPKYFRTPGEYTPGADCIGDLLSDSGYDLSYIGGADLGFSGKGRFYKGHGFDTVVGDHELFTELGPELPKSKWGAYDDAVFAKAKQEFIRLNSKGTPFALFLLTTASHPPQGYPSPSCADRKLKEFNQPMLAAINCSDQEVYEFIQWLRAQANKNLVIVAASDHLQVAGDLHGRLQQIKNRENLFIALGDPIPAGEINRTATMMDVAPTLASLLGFNAQEIGLGRNLLKDGQTLPEKYGPHEFNQMVPHWRTGIGIEPPSPP